LAWIEISDGSRRREHGTRRQATVAYDVSSAWSSIHTVRFCNRRPAGRSCAPCHPPSAVLIIHPAASQSCKSYRPPSVVPIMHLTASQSCPSWHPSPASIMHPSPCPDAIFRPMSGIAGTATTPTRFTTLYTDLVIIGDPASTEWTDTATFTRPVDCSNCDVVSCTVVVCTR
jgi:hypothetical protein